MPKPILLVDDALSSLHGLAQALGGGGYAAMVVPVNAVAVEHFAAIKPDLVFVSLGLNEPMVICEGIRSDPDGAIVPIVLVGRDHPEVRSPADALNQGADYFFELPVDYAKVLAKVATYIGPGQPSAVPIIELPGSTVDEPPPPAAAAAPSAGLPPPPAVSAGPPPAAAAAPSVGLPPPPTYDWPNLETAVAAPAATTAALASSSDALLAVIEAQEARLVEGHSVDAGVPSAALVPGAAVEESARHEAEESARRQAEEARRSAEETARREAEESARRAEEEAWRRTEQELKLHAEESARRRNEDELRRRLEEETRRRLEDEVRRKVEEETRRKLEDELRRRADEEMRKKLEDETRKRIEEETRGRLEEEARRRAESQVAKEAELRRQVEQDLRREMGLPAAGALPDTGSVTAAAPTVQRVVAAPNPPASSVGIPAATDGVLEPTRDLATVLFALRVQQVTGRVDFVAPNRQKSVFFERGIPVDAFSSQAYDRIEEYLLREGRVTRAQYQDVRVKALRGPRRVAAYLASEGYLKPDELFAAVRGHLQETLYGLFEWEDGAYHLLSERASEEDRVPLDVDLRAIIVEGIRRKYLLPRMMTRIGGPSSVVTLRASLSDLEPLRLTAEERTTARLLDGTRSLEDVVFSSGVEALRVYHVVTALVAIGMAEVTVRGIEGLSRDGASGADSIDRGRIADRLEQARNLDYFEILGLARTATAFEIDRAYEYSKNQCQPARFSNKIQEEMRDELIEIDQVLGEARAVLRDERLRQSYARHLPR